MFNQFRFWLLVLVLMRSGTANAQFPLPADGSFSARGHIEYLADSSGRLTLAQVWRDSSRFRPVQTSHALFGVGQPPHWLRFRVRNDLARTRPFIIEVSYPHLTHVRFYKLSLTGRLLRDSGPMGWPVLPQLRSINHRNPLLALTLGPGEQAWVYVRVNNPSQSLRVPIRLWTASTFTDHDRWERLFWYGLTGILAWLVFTNLVLFLLLGERVYGLYGLYMLLVTAYLTVSEGFWLEWFSRIEYGPFHARHLVSVLTGLSILSGFYFIRDYVLRPVWTVRPVRWLFRTAVSLLFLALLLTLVGTHVEWLYIQQIAWLGPFMSLLYGWPVLLMFGLVSYAALWPPVEQPVGFWYSPARLYLLGVLPLVVLSIGSILRNHAVLSDHYLLGYGGVALGYLFEFAVLSIGLGFRYKRTADERQQLVQETFSQRQQLLETQLQVQQDELRTTQALLYAQQEKERIARDLHDHVGAQLSVIAANANTPTSEQASLMSDYAREAMQSLRDTVWAIDQPALTLADFRAKLQQYLNRQQQQHPACAYTLTMTTPDDPGLTSAQALNLFRQVQEAVNNAFKHAHATAVTVQCDLLNDYLHLSISDNGQGFDARQLIDGSPQYGLRNLQRRATDMHGECCIESEPGRGTTVSVTIPLTV